MAAGFGCEAFQTAALKTVRPRASEPHRVWWRV
jgi:hypothetical protein